MRTFLCGLLGAGFMAGKTHPRAIRTASQILAEHGVQLVVAQQWVRDKAKHDSVRALTGAENVTDDLNAVIDGSDIVFNCLPNKGHRDPTIQALQQGKHVVCEKPLGATLPDALAIVDAAQAAGTHTLVSTCYVGADAVRAGREIVRGGGVIANSTTPWFEGRFNFLQDWGIGARENWRFGFDIAGPGGILDDLMQHSMSVLFAWLGQGYRVTDVKADIRYAKGENDAITFLDGTDPSAKSRAVDAATATIRFAGGSTVTFEASRFATGHKAFSHAELNGKNGSIVWQLQNGQLLQHFDHKVSGPTRGWTEIHTTSAEHGNRLSVPGLTQGYETYFANLFADFALGIVQGKKSPTYDLGGVSVTPFVPDFAFGLFLQKLTNAMLQSGYNGGTWTKVNF